MDDLLEIEDRFQEQGREEGRLAGVAAGFVEGRFMGCEKGFSVQQEVGYYQGMTESLLYYINKMHPINHSCLAVDQEDDSEETATQPSGISPRLHKALDNLHQSILLFPMVNDQQDLESLLRSIRIKFKLARSLLLHSTDSASIPVYSSIQSIELTMQESLQQGHILSNVLNASSLATPEERMKSIDF